MEKFREILEKIRFSIDNDEYFRPTYPLKSICNDLSDAITEYETKAPADPTTLLDKPKGLAIDANFSIAHDSEGNPVGFVEVMQKMKDFRGVMEDLLCNKNRLKSNADKISELQFEMDRFETNSPVWNYLWLKMRKLKI